MVQSLYRKGSNLHVIADYVKKAFLVAHFLPCYDCVTMMFYEERCLSESCLQGYGVVNTFNQNFLVDLYKLGTV